MKIEVTHVHKVNVTTTINLNQEILDEEDISLEKLWQECFDQNMPPQNEWTNEQIGELADYWGSSYNDPDEREEEWYEGKEFLDATVEGTI